jgi:hypothetical protein
MRKKSLGLVHLLLLLAVVFLGVRSGLAQRKPAPQSKPTAQATKPAQPQATPGKVWFKDPNSIMPMRKMTNAEHRAAAERNKARQQQAEAQRKQSKTNLQSGVKQ